VTRPTQQPAIRFVTRRHGANHVQLGELAEIHHMCFKFTILPVPHVVLVPGSHP
jgi:hypothetical protein